MFARVSGAKRSQQLPLSGQCRDSPPHPSPASGAVANTADSKISLAKAHGSGAGNLRTLGTKEAWPSSAVC